jgi:hypothetical protein
MIWFGLTMLTICVVMVIMESYLSEAVNNSILALTWIIFFVVAILNS